ncbi:MAG: thioredoxin 1 [Myxococcota bacterium]|jgi:thioredoxin 1
MGKKSREKKLRRERIERGEPARPVEAKKARIWPEDEVLMANDANFDELVGQSPVPVLVDFWATWCGPCKALAPTLEALAKERAGKLRVVKYDTDKNKGVATDMNIRSLPTLVIFKEGEVKDIKMGFMEPDPLLHWVDKTIGLKKGLLSRLTRS